MDALIQDALDHCSALAEDAKRSVTSLKDAEASVDRLTAELRRTLDSCDGAFSAAESVAHSAGPECTAVTGALLTELEAWEQNLQSLCPRLEGDIAELLAAVSGLTVSSREVATILEHQVGTLLPQVESVTSLVKSLGSDIEVAQAQGQAHVQDFGSTCESSQAQIAKDREELRSGIEAFDKGIRDALNGTKESAQSGQASMHNYVLQASQTVTQVAHALSDGAKASGSETFTEVATLCSELKDSILSIETLTLKVHGLVHDEIGVPLHTAREVIDRLQPVIDLARALERYL